MFLEDVLSFGDFLDKNGPLVKFGSLNISIDLRTFYIFNSLNEFSLLRYNTAENSSNPKEYPFE